MKFTNKTRSLSLAVVLLLLLAGCTPKEQYPVTQYETGQYNQPAGKEQLFAETLCVAKEDVPSEQYAPSAALHAAGIFDVSQNRVLYSSNIHERLYPASTTKLLTLYLALKYGTLDDVVTVSEEAVSVPSDSSVAGLRKGDRLTLRDLLYGLMLPSGNDSAVAIAVHLSGSESAFTELMNREARALGATNSHFVNAHGYHHENHYTTAYDLYLIMNQCITNPTFLDIISSPSYSAVIQKADGASKEITWRQTNQYITGVRDVPNHVTVIGGKTGTTNEAGACLVLFSKDSSQRPYISIIMGADSKGQLYHSMSTLLTAIGEQ